MTTAKKAKKKIDRTVGERMDRYRGSGRQVCVILRSREASEALERLAKRHGSIRAAVEAALLQAAGRDGAIRRELG